MANNNEKYPWKPSKYSWEEVCSYAEELALRGYDLYAIAEILDVDTEDIIDALKGSCVRVGA